MVHLPQGREQTRIRALHHQKRAALQFLSVQGARAIFLGIFGGSFLGAEALAFFYEHLFG